MNEFDWDDGKLEIAKFAYDYVYDLENYYKVYNLFTFSSSGEELEEFIQSKTKFLNIYLLIIKKTSRATGFLWSSFVFCKYFISFILTNSNSEPISFTNLKIVF